ncbi:hypothetical protein [Nostoc sp. FACHB-145]|nr:hypothetical protein [Nostoc sp. FACHB-145]
MGLRQVEKIVYQESEQFNVQQVRIEYQRPLLAKVTVGEDARE